jgi:hypothetical protein
MFGANCRIARKRISLFLQAPLLGILALAAFVQGITALGVILLVATAACFFVGRRAKKPDQLRAEGLLKRLLQAAGSGWR